MNIGLYKSKPAVPSAGSASLASRNFGRFFETHPNAKWRGTLCFSRAAHEGQFRKGRQTPPLPYISHPVAVARLVTCFCHDLAMVQAALLHDVIEDTSVKPVQIENAFGADVLGLVMELTEVARPEDGNRAARHKINVAHLAGISARAKTIKCMDVAHNLHNIVRADPAFAPTYIAEKRDVIATLQGASDPRALKVVQGVWQRAHDAMQAMQESRDAMAMAA